jgi:hypothetical protein
MHVMFENSQADLATKSDLVQLEMRLVIKLGAVIFASFGLFSVLMAYIMKGGV